MALTVTNRGTGTHNTGATTLVVTGPSANVPAGSALYLALAFDNAGSGGATVAGGSPLSIAVASNGQAFGGWFWNDNLYDNGVASAGIETMLWGGVLDRTFATTDTITITWAGGVSVVAKAWTWTEISAPSGASPQGDINNGYTTVVGATAANLSRATPKSVKVGDVTFGVYAAENVNSVTGDSDTTNGSWSTLQQATVGSTTSGVRIATQAKVQTTTASTQTWDVTVASQDRIGGVLIIEEMPAPTALSLTWTGATPTVTNTTPGGTTVLPTTLALVTTYSTPVIGAGLLPTALAMTWTGSTPVIKSAVFPSTLAMTWTGSTPVIGLKVAPSTLALTWTGATPTVVATANNVALPTTLAMTWTGSTPSVTVGQNPQPSALAITWTGSTPTVVATANNVAAPTALSLVTSYGTPVIGKDARPTALAIAWTGSTPTIAVTDHQRPQPPALAVTWVGATPLVTTGGFDSGAVVSLPTALAMAWTGDIPTIRVTANGRPHQQLREGSGRPEPKTIGARSQEQQRQMAAARAEQMVRARKALTVYLRAVTNTD